MKKISQGIAAFWYGFLMLPLVAFAQITNPGSGPQNPGSGPQNPGSGPQNISGWETLANPLGNVTLTGFFIKIIQILIIFAIPIIVFFIILAGFKYVTARGNMEKVKEATQALTWAIVGGVLILGAEALLLIIQNTVNAIR